MAKRSLSGFILVVTLLMHIHITQPTLFDNSNGFISNNHVRYVVDDIAAIQGEIVSESLNNLKMKLKFQPEYLDFKQRPLGVPHLEKVVLFNTDKNQSIDMTSISGSTVHFHSSFFEDKKIPPLGNTTFNVVFLGREEGSIESSLFIHTNEGHFKYQVKGASVFSPYRLRPIVGIKIPTNVIFSPIIYMHNPHREPIQITEVYSSGGDFHLELPNGDIEGPKDIWEIKPYKTKPVIKLEFNSKTVQNHTAYVRIKLNNTEEILVVPLEIEVADGSLYSPQGSIDFGIGGSLDPPKKVPLFLVNPTKKFVKIVAITTDCKAIKIDLITNKMPHDLTSNKLGNPIAIANLTLNWKTAFEFNDFSGKIKVTFKNGKSHAEIPFYLTVVNGGLFYNSSATKFYFNPRDKIPPRKFSVRNDFHTPITIINASLSVEAAKYFTLSDFKVALLSVKQEQHIFSIKIKDSIKAECKVRGFINIQTNVTYSQIPIVCYDGKLTAYSHYHMKDILNLGLIGTGSNKTFTILLANENPVSIKLNNQTDLSVFKSMVFSGCISRFNPSMMHQDSFENIKPCENYYVKPKEAAVFKIGLFTSYQQPIINGKFSIVTSFELLVIPVRYHLAPGKLEIGPDRLVFDECFPGKICSHPLKVHSTFNEVMIINDIYSVPYDCRLYAKLSGYIPSKTTKVIGNLYLDPKLLCKDDCYLGMNVADLSKWLITLRLHKSAPEFDVNLLNIFYNRFLNATHHNPPNHHHNSPSSTQHWQNLTMCLDTVDHVRGHHFNTRVRFSWPSLLQENDPLKAMPGENHSTVLKLPLAQVGATSYQNITLRNPSSYNLLVQVVFDHFYPDYEVLYEGLPPVFITSRAAAKRSDDGVDVDERVAKATPASFFFHERHNLEELAQDFQRAINMALALDDDSIGVVLKPNETFTITVGFHAYNSGEATALLFLRNNMTVLEVLELRGNAAQANFKFGNRKPGSSQPLAFELTEKHLKDCEYCDHTKQTTAPPNLTVKRSFTARNLGDITIHVHTFLINNLPCTGYGFRVLNCESFSLPPNATRKINIAFTPDFTLAKITRTLSLVTSLNQSVNYTLLTTVPYNYLALCAGVLARHPWESHLYYILAVMMTVTLVVLVVMVLLESDRVVKDTLTAMAKQCGGGGTQHTLDLRLVGAQIRAEIKVGGGGGQRIAEGEQQQQQQQQQQSGESICKKSPGGCREKVQEVAVGKRTTKGGETEKYTAVVSSHVGKVKKRVAKKCESTETTNVDNPKKIATSAADTHRSQKPKVQIPVVTSPVTEQPAELAARSKIVHKERKQPEIKIRKSQQQQEYLKPVIEATTNPVNCNFYEEETSSTTTTESGCSKDDDLKSGVKSKNSKVDKQKVERRKSTPKSMKLKEAKSDKENHDKQPFLPDNHTNITIPTPPTNNNTTIVPKHKSNKYGNKDHLRRDKQPLSKKHSLDKNAKLNTEITSNGTTNTTSPQPPACYSPSSFATLPIAPINKWDENRASFSDVVARNDVIPATPPSSNNSARNVVPTLKPARNSTSSLLVNNYSTEVPLKSASLGPIGSKKMDMLWQQPASVGASTNNYQQPQAAQIEPKQLLSSPVPLTSDDSFLKKAYESSNAFLDFNAIEKDTSGTSWLKSAGSTDMFGLTEPENDATNVLWNKSFDQPATSTTGTNYWDPAPSIYNNSVSVAPPPQQHSPHLVPTPCVAAPSAPSPNNNSTPNAGVVTAVSSHSGYLWGGSSVWQPWQPPPSPPRTPTRTPPGFTPRVEHEEEPRFQEPLQQPHLYNPFGNNIWNQQQNNPWNYPQGQQ